MPRRDRGRRRRRQQQQQQQQQRQQQGQTPHVTGDEDDNPHDGGMGDGDPPSPTATTNNGGGGGRGRGARRRNDRGRGGPHDRGDDSVLGPTVASAALDAALAIASGGGVVDDDEGGGGGLRARLDLILEDASDGDEDDHDARGLGGHSFAIGQLSSDSRPYCLAPLAGACLDAMAVSDAGRVRRRAARAAVACLSAALLALQSPSKPAVARSSSPSLHRREDDEGLLLREIELAASGVRDAVRAVRRCVRDESDAVEDLSFLLADLCRRSNHDSNSGASVAVEVEVEANLMVRALVERARKDRRFEGRVLGRILASVDSELYDHVLPHPGGYQRWMGGGDDASAAAAGDRGGVRSYVARLRAWSSAMLVRGGDGGLPSWDLHDRMEMGEFAARARVVRLRLSGEDEGGDDGGGEQCASDDSAEGVGDGGVGGGPPGAAAATDADTTAAISPVATSTAPEIPRRHPPPVPVPVPSPGPAPGRGGGGIDPHERMVSAGSVLEAVDVFLKSDEARPGSAMSATATAAATPAVTMLLLAGPAGCGKTHTCDVVQRRAAAAARKGVGVSVAADREPGGGGGGGRTGGGAGPVTVIRPTLPADIMDENVGASEDALISLFNFALLSVASSSPGGGGDDTDTRCIVILDGIPHIVGEGACNDGGGGGRGPPSSLGGRASTSAEETHLVTRMRGTFLSTLDSLRRRRVGGCGGRGGGGGRSRVPALAGGGHILLLCTCGTTGIGGMVGRGVADRFDAVFSLPRLPDERGRRHILSSFLPSRSGIVDGVDARADDSGAGGWCDKESSVADATWREEVLSRLVLRSVGKSAAEISKFCRDAILSVAAARSETADGTEPMNSSTAWECEMLEAMERSLHLSAPESIRGGSLDGVVDVIVETSEDLLADSEGRPLTLPLFGADARTAWEELESLIVTPLCRSELLDELLFGGGDSGGRDGHAEAGAPMSSTSLRRIGTGAKSNPARRQSGRVVCGGALLVGPPGCGKSVLARYCAASAAYALPLVRLLHVSCTSLVHKEVGGSERAVRATFAAARAAAPCVLVLDGIENVARVRGNDTTTEGTMDRVLSTLLTEMDGIEDATDDETSMIGNRGGVAVIGITNDARWIDPALRRPNRLEKCVELDHPDRGARTAIVMRQIRHLPVDFAQASFFEPKSKQNIADFISIQTTGASATEVVAVCNEACMVCIRKLLEDRRDEGNSSTQVVIDGNFNVGSVGPLLRPQYFKDALRFRKTGSLS